LSRPLPAPRIELHASTPPGWSQLMDRCPAAEFTAGATWCELAARHYQGASCLFLTAELEGLVVGGLPVVARRRRGLRRLESSVDGTLAGPQVAADLDPAAALAVRAALGRALAEQLGGATVLAAVTVAADEPAGEQSAFSRRGWARALFDAGVVDCRQGLDHVEKELWTNNRRNERNRGLKRGCTLQAEHDPETVARWYPLYAAESEAWAQAPVPLSFFQELLTLPDRRCVLNTVRLDGELIAGHFSFRSRDRLVAWQGAARPDVRRTHFPTTLVYWQGISWACEQGLAAVDFGGSVGRDSLRDFKRRCGARPWPRCQWTSRSRLGRVLSGVADRLRGRTR
jgi:hypothetical protein